jgi:spore coat protein U-like protein
MHRIHAFLARALALCFVLSIMHGPVFAQSCAVGTSGISFGNVSTITGSPINAIGTISFDCSGFTTTTVRLCLSIGAPGGDTWTQKYLNGPSGKTLAYNIYSDATHQTLWGSYYSSGAPPLVTVDTPVTGGSASTSVFMYAQMSAGQTSAVAGAYSKSFSTSDTMFVYIGYTGTPPNCMTTTSPQTRASFTVTASVAADCNIVAAPLTFPNSGLLTQALQATTSLQVTCVSGAPYTVALDGGTTPGGTVAQRMLASGGGATIGYQLYQDAAYTQVWGDGTLGTTTGAGTGTGIAQTFTVYGRVPPQTSPPVGVYTDTITATVQF